MGGGSSKQPVLYDGPGEITHGPISGEFTHDSVRLLARGSGEGILHFDISDGWFARTQRKVTVTKAADFTGQVTIKGLVPDTVHRYRVAWTPKGKAPNFNRDGVKQGSFRTAPLPGASKAFTFQFGSCIGGQNFGRQVGRGWEIFRTMKSFNPDFFLLLGDSVYADDVIKPEGGMFCHYQSEPGAEEKCETLEEFHARYRHHLEDPHWSEYLSTTATYNTWDDHEIHDDWGGPKLKTTKPGLLKAGMQAFFDYWPLERGGEQGTRVYRSFKYGTQAEFFILDCRQYRSVHGQDSPDATPYMETMLGAEQKKWLKEGVINSNATWKFIISSVPVSWPTGWPTPDVDGYDGWSDQGAQEELASLLAIWRERGIVNYVFLSADVHFPWVSSYDPFEDGKPLFYEFGSTPLSALCLPPSRPADVLRPSVLYSEGAFNGDLRNFGQITIQEDSTLVFRLLDENGSEHYSMLLDAEESLGPRVHDKHKSQAEDEFTADYLRKLGLDEDGKPLPEEDNKGSDKKEGESKVDEEVQEEEEDTPTPKPEETSSEPASAKEERAPNTATSDTEGEPEKASKKKDDDETEQAKTEEDSKDASNNEEGSKEGSKGEGDAEGKKDEDDEGDGKISAEDREVSAASMTSSRGSGGGKRRKKKALPQTPPDTPTTPK